MRPGIRRCLACRCLNHRDLLFRFQLRADKLHKVRSAETGGPSVYICRNHDCLEKSLKRRLLQKRWKQLTEAEIHSLITALKSQLPQSTGE